MGKVSYEKEELKPGDEIVVKVDLQQGLTTVVSKKLKEKDLDKDKPQQQKVPTQEPVEYEQPSQETTSPTDFVDVNSLVVEGEKKPFASKFIDLPSDTRKEEIPESSKEPTEVSQSDLIPTNVAVSQESQKDQSPITASLPDEVRVKQELMEEVDEEFIEPEVRATVDSTIMEENIADENITEQSTEKEQQPLQRPSRAVMGCLLVLFVSFLLLLVVAVALLLQTL